MQILKEIHQEMQLLEHTQECICQPKLPLTLYKTEYWEQHNQKQ